MGIISTDLKPYYSEDRTDRIRTIGGPPVFHNIDSWTDYFVEIKVHIRIVVKESEYQSEGRKLLIY